MNESSEKQLDRILPLKALTDYLRLIFRYDSHVWNSNRDSFCTGSDYSGFPAKRELIWCLTMPFVIMVFALAFQFSGLDSWLASQFYDEIHHVWPLREYWLVLFCIVNLVR